MAWGQPADVCERFVHKGTQLYIEGRLRTRKYTDSQGVEKYTTEINVDTLQLLGRRDDNYQSDQQQGGYQQGGGYQGGGYQRQGGYQQQGGGYQSQGGYQQNAYQRPAPPVQPVQPPVQPAQPAPAVPEVEENPNDDLPF